MPVNISAADEDAAMLAAYAQQNAIEAQAADAKNTIAVIEDAAHARQPWWSNQNAMTMSAAILLFGAAVIAIAAFTSPKDASIDSKLRLYGTIMVLTLVGFVVVAGYNDQQIAAPLGLLGTIAGYLLGRAGNQDPKVPSPPPKEPPNP